MTLKIFAMVPARMGSTRFRMKNLSLLNNKPLISYVIESAKDAKIFSKIFINSEDALFSEISKKMDVEFYQRPVEFGSSEAKSDQVVYDFIKKNPCDVIAWVNPIAPFQPVKEMQRVISYFVENDLDSLITTTEEQVHCNFKKLPLNYVKDELFAKTQDLVPLERFVYSMMVWKTKTFVEKFEKDGNAIFCGKFSTFPVSKLSSLLLKTEEDYKLLNSIAIGLSIGDANEARYDDLIKRKEN